MPIRTEFPHQPHLHRRDPHGGAVAYEDRKDGEWRQQDGTKQFQKNYNQSKFYLMKLYALFTFTILVVSFICFWKITDEGFNRVF